MGLLNSSTDVLPCLLLLDTLSKNLLVSLVNLRSIFHSTKSPMVLMLSLLSQLPDGYKSLPPLALLRLTELLVTSNKDTWTFPMIFLKSENYANFNTDALP